MDQVKFVEDWTAFKKFEGVWSAFSNILKAVFHKFFLVHSSILCPKSAFILVAILPKIIIAMEPAVHMY